MPTPFSTAPAYRQNSDGHSARSATKALITAAPAINAVIAETMISTTGHHVLESKSTAPITSRIAPADNDAVGPGDRMPPATR
jgi:hypothetical protein